MSKVSVIKIGGKVIEDRALLTEFLRDFAALSEPKVLIHGGGRSATQMAQRLGLETRLIDGRRVTDTAMLEVIVMVYGGWVNKLIVSTLQSFNCQALGLTGADANLIRSVRRDPHPVDFGHVGDVRQVRSDLLDAWLSQGLVPVLAPVTHDGAGQLLNTNADTIAREVAVALSASRATDLYYLFEKAGVLRDAEDDTSVIPQLSEDDYQRLRTEGRVVAGMIPKLDNAFDALHQGVENVYIAHHRSLNRSHSGTQLWIPHHSPPQP